MSLIEKLAHLVWDRKVPVPAMPGLSVPTISFGSKATVKIIFLTVMVALGAVSVGMYFAIRDVVGSTYNWPDAAVYQANADGLGTMGNKLPNYDNGEESHTLKINLADGTRIDKLTLRNLDLGKVGLTDAFQIQRTTGVTGAQAYLWVGEITIKNSAMPTLAWSDIQTGCLNLAPKTDGHTQETTLVSTIPSLVIDSDRGSSTYTAENTIVDRIILEVNGSTYGASIGHLEIDDVDATLGAWTWKNIRAGCITMDNTNEIGNGTGINVSSAVWADTVEARIVTDNIVDTPINVR